MRSKFEVDKEAVIQQVLSHMGKLGIAPHEHELIADGEMHRYTVEGDKASSDNGFYLIHTDGCPAWCIGTWKGDIKENGKFDFDLLDDDEARQKFKAMQNDPYYQAYIKRVEQEREAQREAKRLECTRKAQEEFNSAPPVTAEHQYLKRKGITDIKNFRLGAEGEVLVPLYSAQTGKFQSLQRIYPDEDRKKNFFAGAPIGEACYTFEHDGAINERLHIVCEGIATGQTVFNLAGRRCRVTCAMMAGNLYKVVAGLRKRYPSASFIMAADNDLQTEAAGKGNAGRKDAQEVVNRGLAKGIVIPDFKENEDGSDWNDYAFLHGEQKAAEEFNRQLDVELSQDNETARADFEHEAVAYCLNDFLKSIKEGREGKAIPTGFKELDRLLSGGLYPGLYIVGAISSLGKTTFCTQITDQIAQAGYGVLIFSLEMSRNELIAKSLSRLTLINCTDIDDAFTTREILRADKKTDTAYKVLLSAVQDYSAYTGKLYITEGLWDVGVKEIEAKIKQFMTIYEKPPIVLIDYLQILSTDNERLTDKQAVDNNVKHLKQLSRDMQIPVIGISSFNRENYSSPVSMASFKESGAIEYSSDVLIGLQYEGWDYQEKEAKEKRTQRIFSLQKNIQEQLREGKPAPVQVKILKHRNGNKGEVRFNFYPRFNYFEERANYEA